MFIKRKIQIEKHLQEKSILLLGPRQSGKSFLLRKQIKHDKYINLFYSEDFKKFSYNPSSLEDFIGKGKKTVIIDEIQKLPNLMDEVHSLIEKRKDIKFILTGSSAKSLKLSHTSLMAGRVRVLHLCPFIFKEVEKHKFDLNQFLLFGGLPPAYLSKNPWDELKDYAGSYLREEIQATAFVRKIENYSRFLDAAAISSGQLLNYESIASDTFIPARTIKDYYALLEETLIGYSVNSMRSKNSRKEISNGKFYFFDIGVLNSLLKRNKLSEKTKEFGELFEHFIFLELKAYQLYTRADWSLEFWRTHSQDEVDFVLEKGEAIIEVKATTKVQPKHLAGLKKFATLYPTKKKILVCREEKIRIIDDIIIYPWKDFINTLWANDIIKPF